MAERLNDEQLRSVREQMVRRAYGYDKEVQRLLNTGPVDDLLVQRRQLQAALLRKVAFGIGMALGEEEPFVDFGSGEVEEFRPDLNVFWVPEAEWWRPFQTRVEAKQGPMYPRRDLPDRPVDTNGGHETRP